MIFSAAILAGGDSKRMGRNKANLRIGGRTLADEQIAKLWMAGASEVLLSVRSAQGQVRRANCRIIEDDRPRCGPLGGLLSCLDRMKTDLLLVCAVDLPLANAETLARLVHQAHRDTGIVYRNSNGYFEPLLAVYPRRLRNLARGRLANDQFSLQPLIASAVEAGLMRALPLPEALRIRMTNINTPEDFAHLLIHFPEIQY